MTALIRILNEDENQEHGKPIRQAAKKATKLALNQAFVSGLPPNRFLSYTFLYEQICLGMDPHPTLHRLKMWLEKVYPEILPQIKEL